MMAKGVPPLFRTRSAVSPLKDRGRTHKLTNNNGPEPTAVVVKDRSPFWMRSRPCSAWASAIAAAITAIVVVYALTSNESTDASVVSSNSIGRANSTLDNVSTAFLTWFQENGGRTSDKISIATFERMGRGISSRAPITADEELLFVPLDLIICRETILKHATRKLLPKYDRLRDHPAELLTAFLLLEQFKDSSSFWYPYLKLLPPYPSHFAGVASPLFFDSVEDVKELQDERIIQASTQEREQVKVAFQRFRRLFKSVLPADSKVSPILKRRYTWARFLINSRAFSIRGDRFLVPFGDVFNGKPQPGRRITRDGTGDHFLLYHRLHEGVGINILADRSVLGTNEQVFEDYGDNDNYNYFLYHGFVMEDNPYDCATIELPTTLLEPAKRRFVVEQYQRYGGSAQVCITEQGRLRSRIESEMVQFYASMMAMDEHYAEVLCSIRDANHLCVKFATQAQQEFVLVEAIRHQLNQYPTAEDQDKDLLESAEVSPARRHAIQFRLTRKRILKSALLRLEKVRGERPDLQISWSRLQQQDLEAMSLESKVRRFSTWIGELGFPINHLELKYVSPAMGFGTFATRPIDKGETYLSVPPEVVMDTGSALRSAFIRDLIVNRQSSNTRWTDSQFLVVHLLHEKFAPSHRSNWQAYLDVLPDYDHLGSPLFYPKDGPELRLLQDAVPLDLWRLVHEYRERVDAEYESLSAGILVSGWITRERFRWAMAILDSHSIWWSGSRHLVPLLDMVNCMEISHEHSPHATRLNEDGDSAITEASWDFKKGDQIVENYAQPNYIYLLYHGFVLRDNSYDCAHFHFELDKARFLPPHDKNRKLVIAQMESMKLYSWSHDVCLGGKKSDTLEKLLRLALIAKSPERAAEVERQAKGKLTRDHFDTAAKLTKESLTRLNVAIEKHSKSKEVPVSLEFGEVIAYIEQQRKLLTDVLRKIEMYRSEE